MFDGGLPGESDADFSSGLRKLRKIVQENAENHSVRVQKAVANLQEEDAAHVKRIEKIVEKRRPQK